MDQWTLRDYVEWKRERGELLEILEEVWVEDLPEAMELLSSESKAVIFTKVHGYSHRVIANLVASSEALEALFGPNAESEFLKRLKGPPPAKEVLPFEGYEELDVGDLAVALPLLHHYEGDVAPFVTAGVVHAYDPWNNVVARGIHRLQFRGGSKLGVALLNPPLRTLLENFREKGTSFPVVVTIGHHPLVLLAMAMKTALVKDKIENAGSLCGTLKTTYIPGSDIEIPWGTEFVLEGTVDPKEEARDGPMGEVNGYYLTIERTPTITVKRGFAKKDALYHAILPTGAEADAYLAFVSKVFMFSDLKERFPFVQKVFFIPYTFGASVVVQVTHSDRASINNMMLTVLSNPMVKKCVVVDEDINPSDLQQVEWAIITRCWADEDVFILPRLKGQAIDSELRRGFIHKIGINTAGKADLLQERARVRRGNPETIKRIKEHYLGGKN